MVASIRGCVIFTVCLAVFIGSVNASIIENVVVTEENFVLLGKFCFGTDTPGTDLAGTINIELSTAQQGINIVIYDDQADSWPDVYGGGGLTETCAQRVARGKDPPGVMPTSVTTGAEAAWSRTVSINENLRPRFWYVVATTCSTTSSPTTGMSFVYKLTFLNPGGQQFSYDQQGLLPVFIVFFLLWVAGCVVHSIGVRQLARAQAYHPIVKLLSSALLSQTLSLLCHVIHYWVFSADGMGVVGLEGLALLLDMISILLFTLLLILVAKGWTISTTELENYLPEVVLPMMLLTVLYFALVIYTAGQDAVSTPAYVYDSAPGYAIVALHLILALWFAMRIRATRQSDADEGRKWFYKWFGITFFVWFFSLPADAAIAAMLDTWVRTRVVATLVAVQRTFWYSIMVYLLWPGRAHRRFDLGGIGNSDAPYEAIGEI